MQPIDELLHRIRWDADFGRGAFAIGYYDRVLRRELVVSLAAIAVSARRPRTFTFEDDRGMMRSVPLHRIRVVYRNGVAIWRRPPRKA